jgi:hypothetical protein
LLWYISEVPALLGNLHIDYESATTVSGCVKDSDWPIVPQSEINDYWLIMQQSIRYQFYNDIIMSVCRVKVTSLFRFFNNNFQCNIYCNCNQSSYYTWHVSHINLTYCVKKYNLFCVFHRYALRIKFFPGDLKDFYQRDKASFFFLYDQVLRLISLWIVSVSFKLWSKIFFIIYVDKKWLSWACCRESWSRHCL